MVRCISHPNFFNRDTPSAFAVRRAARSSVWATGLEGRICPGQLFACRCVGTEVRERCVLGRLPCALRRRQASHVPIGARGCHHPLIPVPTMRPQEVPCNFHTAVSALVTGAMRPGLTQGVGHRGLPLSRYRCSVHKLQSRTSGGVGERGCRPTSRPARRGLFMGTWSHNLGLIATSGPYEYSAFPQVRGLHITNSTYGYS